MMLLHDKISPLIESQFPSFYREEGPMFVLFVKEYYQWLESTNNPLYHSRHLLDYADIDSTLDEFLPHFQAKYIPNTPTTNIQNQRDLIKHSADLYRTRGTIQSLRLAFQMLYDETVDVYYPGDDILKPSDGKWVAPRYLEVTLTDKARSFIGKDVVGVQSGAKGFVESVERRVHDGQKIDVIYLSNVVNNETTGSTFIAGEYITDDGTHEGCPTVIGSMRSITVTSAGSGFDVGQIVDVVSSLRGKQGKARVTSVGAITGEVNYRLLDGGFGYTKNDTIFGSNTKIIVSSNVITTVAFTSPDPAITSFNSYTYIVQPQANIQYTGNTVVFQTGDVIVGANSTLGVIATGIVLSTNNSGHMLVSPRTTTSIALNTIALPSTTGSFAVGELVFQTTSGANVAHGRVLLANSTTVVVDQRYGPFQTNKTIFSGNSGCTANAVTVTTRAYTDLNFANASVTRIYSNENTSANATVTTSTRMTIYATVVGSNATSVGIINPTSGDTNPQFNANTGVNGATEYIAVNGTHRFGNGDLVKYLVATGNTAIGGLSNNSNYYVVNTSNNTHLQLSTTFGGSAINITASSISEIGHTINGIVTKSFRSGTNAYIHAGGNTSITAEAAVISVGNPGGFQIGQIADTEVAYIGTTLLGGSNTAQQPLLNVPLNATAYGFTAAPTANLSSVVGTVLTQQAYTIGSISSLTNRNPGALNTAKPYVVEIEPAIAAYSKPSRSRLILNQSSTVGTFKLGEQVQQTVSIPAVNVAFSSLNGTFSTNTRELVRQVRSDGVTTYGEMYIVNTINNTARIIVANTANTFNTSNTIVSVANSNVNATPTAVNTLNVDVTAKGTLLNITTVAGTVAPSELYIKQKSFQNFTENGTITGVESGSTSAIASIAGDFSYGVLGNDAVVDPESDVSAGTIKSVEVYDSGFFYENGETVSLVEAGNQITGEGTITADSIGFSAGYWRGEDGTLSSIKKIQDNEYYQEHSYEIRAGIDRTVYEPAIKSLTHVAGTKMFNTFSKTSDQVVDINTVSPYAGSEVTLNLYGWPSNLPTYVNNPNAYGTAASDFFGRSVAVGGNYAAVGAPGEDDAGGASAGKVYVFNAATGALQYTLNDPTAYGTSFTDLFGTSVAIAGNYLIVGAPGESAPTQPASGKAYIYNVTTGSLLYTLDNPVTTPYTYNGEFGGQVQASGIYAAVAAMGQDNTAGRVHVYNITTGTLLYSITDPNVYGTPDSDYFGYIDISASYLAVGAPFEDGPGSTDTGKVYVFNVANGNLLYVLDNVNNYGSASGDYFGCSVKISGNYLIVGARGEGDSSGPSSGTVYVYNIQTGTLLYQLTNPNIAGNGAYNYFGDFGQSLAVSNNYLFVGARGELFGVVYVFDLTTGRCVTMMQNPDYEFNSMFPLLAASGNYLWTTANESDFPAANSGRCYVYNTSLLTSALIDSLPGQQTFVEQKISGVTTASGYVSSYDFLNNKITLINVTGTFVTSPSADIFIGTTNFGTINIIEKNI